MGSGGGGFSDSFDSVVRDVGGRWDRVGVAWCLWCDSYQQSKKHGKLLSPHEAKSSIKFDYTTCLIVVIALVFVGLLRCISYFFC